MLDSAAHVSEIVGVAFAILTPILFSIIRLFTRVAATEDTLRTHGAKLGMVDSLLERLARMDTKLDILMEERHGGGPRRG